MKLMLRIFPHEVSSGKHFKQRFSGGQKLSVQEKRLLKNPPRVLSGTNSGGIDAYRLIGSISYNIANIAA